VTYVVLGYCFLAYLLVDGCDEVDFEMVGYYASGYIPASVDDPTVHVAFNIVREAVRLRVEQIEEKLKK
jgi:hypothetical protein